MSKFKESEAALARYSSKKGALKDFTNHRGQTPILKSPLYKTTSPQSCSFIKKRPQHRHLPTKPAKPPRTPLFTEHLQ